MPGRTPAEALRAFLDPLQRATSCLGSAKLTISGRQPGTVNAWALNGVDGMVFDHGMHFEAQMHFEIIRADDGWRVTTRAYRYRFAVPSTEIFLMHWHPTGHSPYRLPHMHVNFAGLPQDVDMEARHLPSPRMTYEHAISWVLGGGFVHPARPEWEEILNETLQVHLEHRTWSNRPDEANSSH